MSAEWIGMAECYSYVKTVSSIHLQHHPEFSGFEFVRSLFPEISAWPVLTLLLIFRSDLRIIGERLMARLLIINVFSLLNPPSRSRSSKNKNRITIVNGNPVVLSRPVVFLPCFSTGLVVFEATREDFRKCRSRTAAEHVV